MDDGVVGLLVSYILVQQNWRRRLRFLLFFNILLPENIAAVFLLFLDAGEDAGGTLLILLLLGSFSILIHLLVHVLLVLVRIEFVFAILRIIK